MEEGRVKEKDVLGETWKSTLSTLIIRPLSDLLFLCEQVGGIYYSISSPQRRIILLFFIKKWSFEIFTTFFSLAYFFKFWNFWICLTSAKQREEINLAIWNFRTIFNWNTTYNIKRIVTLHCTWSGQHQKAAQSVTNVPQIFPVIQFQLTLLLYIDC